MKLIPNNITDVYAKYVIARGLLYIIGSLVPEDLKANSKFSKMQYGPGGNYKYALTIGIGMSRMGLDNKNVYMYFKAEKPLVATAQDKVKLTEFVLNGVYRVPKLSYQAFYGIEVSNKLMLTKDVSEADIVDLPDQGRYACFAVKM